MGLFGTQKDTQTLSERFSALEGDVRTLKTAQKHLELEWEELYDKVRHQMSRMSKRVKADAPEISLPSEPELTDESGNRVDSISARIHARRASHGGKL